MRRFTDLAFQYIDGQWRPGGGSWDVIDVNPHDGEKLASITVATTAEIDLAYRAAERARPAWAATAPAGRAAVLTRAADLLRERAGELTGMLVAELGGSRRRAALELALAEECLREAARLAPHTEERTEPLPADGGADGGEVRIRREPAGTVCVISSFTCPLLLALRPVAAALALGNAVVLKPHHWTPVCGGTLPAALLAEAGLPPGLLNVVVTDVDEVGDALIEHPAPRVVSFTGSPGTGGRVAAVAAARLKRTVLETGRGGALVVLDDADVDRAVDAAVFSRFVDQGQMCLAASRILVDRAVAGEFTARFTARAATLRIGDPADPDTQIGPMISPGLAESVTAAVDRAVREGAVALLRGETRGSLVPPAVLTRIPDGAAILGREVVGPVALLVPFDGEEEAVRLANGVPYALSAAVHTADAERGVRVARRIRAGAVHVNGATVEGAPVTALGAEGRPGAERASGEALLDAFTTLTRVTVRRGGGAFPL
ncbi:aldehyde dehydrogenase family protein [Streptomyces sp. DH37]|uniref:aldehyde dehydrogenase family protein n=1 Tax=Streptomyces sp. DH37 TaxID=3040122 RepID=UPI002442F996|nr:aldehyde dehydrogenase family protein [Streptomyces sp. DH37]MDG9704690.1 aldehyde dehydrogenase family protein [Streptomyces sp. DH37]